MGHCYLSGYWRLQPHHGFYPATLALRDGLWMWCTLGPSSQSLLHHIYSTLGQSLSNTWINLSALQAAVWSRLSWDNQACSSFSPEHRPEWQPQPFGSPSQSQNLTTLVHAGWAQGLFLKHKILRIAFSLLQLATNNLTGKITRKSLFWEFCLHAFTSASSLNRKIPLILSFENITHKFWHNVLYPLKGGDLSSEIQAGDKIREQQ